MRCVTSSCGRVAAAGCRTSETGRVSVLHRLWAKGGWPSSDTDNIWADSGRELPGTGHVGKIHHISCEYWPVFGSVLSLNGCQSDCCVCCLKLGLISHAILCQTDCSLSVPQTCQLSYLPARLNNWSEPFSFISIKNSCFLDRDSGISTTIS